MSFLTGSVSGVPSGDAETTERVGDAPSFATAGFLSDNGGTNSGSSGGTSGDASGFDPAVHVSRDKRNADGSYTRKRGRKSGGSNSSSGNKTRPNHQASVDALANILVVIHAGISTATKTPEIAIDKDDAETLAKATANVLSEFDITPDPKVTAIVGLIMAAGTVYGPMGLNIRMRKQQEVKQRLEQQV